MSDGCVIAIGAISALGVGERAYDVARPDERAPVVIKRDEVFVTAGLARPWAARVDPANVPASFEDPATALLSAALSQVTSALDALRPGWTEERIGLAVGTSSGGMSSAERLFSARERGANESELENLASRATYFAPLDDALAASRLSGMKLQRRSHFVAACAASTIALGLGLRWLDLGSCDLVIAGGYDALCVFVAMGFEALRATTASTSRPFRIGRDGMALGEGAGLVALVREGDTRGAPVSFRVAGFGASTDAVHITAPDRTGGGLARAGSAAILDSGLSASNIGLVSAHGTATPFNDAMEARAIASLFEGATPPVVHPFKAQIGHTLGAAGVLESLSAAACLSAQVAPAVAGTGELDPDASVCLLERAEPRPLEAALKLSAAFGGANASLVLSRSPSGRVVRAPRPVFVRAHAHITSVDLAELSSLTGVARDRLARLDQLGRLSLRAVAELARVVGPELLAGAGIVAGHAFATIDTNERFDARRRQKGPTFVDPRLFPATSPNAVAGECAIVYKLTGPSFAVNAGFDGGVEALARASDLIAAGDVDRCVVLAVDDAAKTAQPLLASLADRPFAEGAVAVLLDASPDGALGPIDVDITPAHDARSPSPIGHLSLLAALERFATR